jgi:hypothetical protein
MHTLINRPPSVRPRLGSREHLGAEDGVAVIIAMLVMMVMTLLMTAIVTGTVNVSTSSRRESNFTEALGPAEAGARVGLYRLNTVGATAAQCFTTKGVAESGGKCPVQTETPEELGNKAKYEYYVSPVLSSGGCIGSTVSATRTVEQRCITSIGTVNGVRQRVQMRVVGYTPNLEFPYPGILALTGFLTNNVAEFTGNIGSNGAIKLENEAVNITGKIQYSENPVPTVAGNKCTGTCSIEKVSTKFTVPTVAAATEAEYLKAETTNNDAGVTWQKVGPTSIYNASTHVVEAEGTLTATQQIPSGTYFFCSFGTKEAHFETVGTAPVIIYIGSPKCPEPKAGLLEVQGAFTWHTGSTNPNNLQIYVYGKPTCTTSCPADINFTNFLGSASEPFVATFYAPYSTMQTQNATYIDGGIIVNKYSATNALHFNTSGLASGASAGAVTKYYPSAVELCTPGEGTVGC